MTSAVRDASNGAAFADAVRERFGFDARILDGDEEARLTYLGATTARDAPAGERLLVIDIGGGSTELVIGEGGRGRVPRLDPGRRRAPLRAPPAQRPADAATSSPRSPPSVEREIAAAVPARGARSGSPPRSPWPAPRPSPRASTWAPRGSTSRATGSRSSGCAPCSSDLAAIPLERAPRGARAGPRSGPDDRRRCRGSDSSRCARSRSRKSRSSDRDILWGAALETGRSATSN